MGQYKAVTVRLPVDEAAALEHVAEVDEVSLAAATRIAIEQHIQSRVEDPGFWERHERKLERDKEFYQRFHPHVSE